MEGLYHASIAGSVTCMGRLVSRLESISISLFDLTATISSSRPNFPWPLPRSGRQGWTKAIAKRLALDGREHSGRLVGLGRPIPVKVSFRTCFLARFNVANYDDTEGSSPSGASIAP